MKNFAQLFAAAVLVLFSSCGANKEPEEVLPESFVPSVPVEEIPDAPEEQKEALTDVVAIDSTEMDRSFRYDGTYMYISKSAMRLYVLSKTDSVLYSCGIACGIRRGGKQEEGDYRTPEGRFRISGIYESTDWIHRTRDGREVKGCYGPYFLRLATGRFAGIGIHGTNAPGSIGKRASEGCIRVNSRHIVELRNHYAYEGMPVVVSGEYERLPSFAGLTNSDYSTALPPVLKDTARAYPTLPDSTAVRASSESSSVSENSVHSSAKADTLAEHR